ncbi:MAG: helix-turn-helix transcriptional regulator [Clostridia bacterium]|nr:helix-turn-helix transcriptional regulator [Clostridia bacterium]
MKDMSSIKFDGNKLFEIRREKKISQGKLALIVGVTRQTVHLWETNQSLPDVEKVSKICKALDIKLSDLVDGVEEKQEEANTQYVIENKTEVETKPKSKRRYIKIIGIMVLILIMIYIIMSSIKFSRLTKMLNKWEELNKAKSYYLKINKNYIDKGSTDIISENIVYEKYYNDGVLKIVIKDEKAKSIKSIIIYDYNNGNKYVINESEKTYSIEELNVKNKSLKLTDNFELNFSNNNFINFLYCLNPNMEISYDDNYVLVMKGDVRKDFDQETGALKYEENLDSKVRKTRVYYEVELDTNKDFEINLDDYKEVTQ